MRSWRWFIGIAMIALLALGIIAASSGPEGRDIVRTVGSFAVAAGLCLTAFSFFEAASANKMDLTFRFRAIWFRKVRREMREFLYSTVREKLPERIVGLDFANPKQNGLSEENQEVLADALMELLKDQLHVSVNSLRNLNNHSPNPDVDIQKRIKSFHSSIRKILSQDDLKKVKCNAFDALEETIADLETLALLHRRDIGRRFIQEYKPVFEQLAPLILAFIITEQLIRANINYKSQLVHLFADLRVRSLDCRKYPKMQKWVSLAKYPLTLRGRLEDFLSRLTT